MGLLQNDARNLDLNETPWEPYESDGVLRPRGSFEFKKHQTHMYCCLGK